MEENAKTKQTFLVVLDANSATGDLFAKDPDYWFNGESRRNPCLRCVSVHVDVQPYLRAIRLRSEDQSRQEFLVPHHSVVAIFSLGDAEDPRRIGFSID